MLKQLIQISRSLQLKSKFLLSIIAVLLFCFNYQICEFFYSNSLNNWWDLRTNIYAILFAVALTIARYDSKGWIRFVLNVGIGFSVSDVIDRVYFDITVFTQADIYMIIATLLMASIEFYVKRNDK